MKHVLASNALIWVCAAEDLLLPKLEVLKIGPDNGNTRPEIFEALARKTEFFTFWRKLVVKLRFMPLQIPTRTLKRDDGWTMGIIWPTILSQGAGRGCLRDVLR